MVSVKFEKNKWIHSNNAYRLVERLSGIFIFILMKEGGLMARGMVGRPPKYTSKEEIEGLIEKYFAECEGEILKDKDGKAVLNKNGRPIIINQKPPTVTGLALALGFATRQGLLNYQGKKEFLDTITRAKSMVEKYTEERLFDREGVNGAKFSLTNNFKGWNEKVPTELDEEEQKSRVDLLKKKLKENDDEKKEALDKLDEVLKEIDGVI